MPVNVTVAVSPPVLSLVIVPPKLFARLVGDWTQFVVGLE